MKKENLEAYVNYGKKPVNMLWIGFCVIASLLMSLYATAILRKITPIVIVLAVIDLIAIVWSIIIKLDRNYTCKKDCLLSGIFCFIYYLVFSLSSYMLITDMYQNYLMFALVYVLVEVVMFVAINSVIWSGIKKGKYINKENSGQLPAWVGGACLLGVLASRVLDSTTGDEPLALLTGVGLGILALIGNAGIAVLNKFYCMHLLETKHFD